MDEDKFALVERIVRDVHNIMSKNAELLSFEIVPVENNIQNKSPVLYEENCLGIESWCVKHVYMYCYSEVLDNYFLKPKRKALKISLASADRIMKLLNMTLLINPDVSSLWNKRREMTETCLLNKMSELRFTTLVLSRKPKCNDAFAYRRWILDLLFKDELPQNNDLQNLISSELNICQLTADKSPNNYHSWNHRMWFINKLKILKSFNISSQYIKEYEFSHQWTSRHVSDYSCYHYLQYCIKNVCKIEDESSWADAQMVAHSKFRETLTKIVAEHFPEDTTVQASKNDLLNYSDESLLSLLLDSNFCSCKNKFLMCRKIEMLFHELKLNSEMIKFYNHHETLWYHRRFIVNELLEVVYKHFGLVRQHGVLVKAHCVCEAKVLKQAKIIRYDSGCVYSSVLIKVLLSYEQAFVEGQQQAGDNYADRHWKYLKFVKGLTVDDTRSKVV